MSKKLFITLLITMIIVIIYSCNKDDEVSTEVTQGTIKDYDGNVYKTVQIGDQWWMAEDLKTTHYTNGEAITLVTDNSVWADPDDLKMYCYYNNDNSSGAGKYGALYSWFAVMNGASGTDNNPSNVQGVCPDGWHVPSHSEWKEMLMYLGMTQTEVDSENWQGTDQGGQLKASGTEEWLSPNSGATNSSKFSGMPSGTRSYLDGTFSGEGEFCFFWTTDDNTDFPYISAITRILHYTHADITYASHTKTSGAAVRCVKD